MRKRILSFFALAATALAVQAQSWTAPTLKLVTDQIPTVAYIYNVEQAKFLTKGGAWGNHASIKSDVSAAFLYEIQDQGDGSYKLHCSSAEKTGFLGRESEADVYTDYNNQAAWSNLWEFEATEKGYHIRTARASANFGSDGYTEDEVDLGTYILGWNENGEDLTNGNGAPMGTNDGVYMVDPTNAEGWYCEWAFMTVENYNVYNAQCTLYNKLNEAAEIGYSESELAGYAALLNGEDTEAMAEAVAKLDDLILNYAYNHATPDDPFDVTAKIQNPTFEGARNAEPAGWIDEFGNMLIQNNKAYYVWDDEAGAESTEYGLNNFSQNWTSSNTEPIAASNIYQVISDLPQGTYILQADAIATSASADLPVSGAELYAESGAVRYSAAIDKSGYGMTGSSNPHRYQLTIVHMGGDLTIGYGFTPGYVKWFAVDNFKLYYAGPVDNPGLVALIGTIAAAKPYVDDYEDVYYYSEASKNALEEAINDADTSADSDECLVAATTINELLAAVKAEVGVYSKFDKFVKQVSADIEKYPFIEDLPDNYDLYLAGYEDKTATVEQINAWMNGYADYIKAGIQKALPTATEESPIEVTGLFANLGFEENTAESATPNSWTCGASAFKARANVGEVWNTTFDAYTVLTNLPAGAYRITAHGLSRSGSSDENYVAEGAGITAEFYANNAAVKVVSQHLGAGAEQLYTNDVNLTGDETNPLWAPNSMEGARVYFNVEETPYVNTLTANLINDGDELRIGFRDNGTDGTVLTNTWTIWSDLRIYYIGVSSNALYEEMLNVAANAEAAIETSLVIEAQNKLQTAVDAAAKLNASSSEEAITEVINQLSEAIQYANKGMELINTVMAMEENYQDVVNEYDAADSELAQILDAVSAAISSEEFQSNEQIQGWIDALPAARTAHVFAAMLQNAEAAPSEATPLDITAVLTNASFETNDATGWTLSNTGGSVGGSEAQRTGSTAYEAWNATAFDAHQTVVGLQEGYYRLTCKALFRNGNNSDDLAAAYSANADSINGLAQFYANDEKVNIKSIYQDALDEDPAIDGQASYLLDGTTYYTPNTMISFERYAMDLNLYTNELWIHLDGKTDLTVGVGYETTAGYAWFPFDEFTIAYIGTEAPTAVESVEANTSARIAGIFNINGQQQARLHKGINIVRKADGTVTKILVR